MFFSPVTVYADAELGNVRVGVLKFGTVNWELDVIRHNGLDKKAGVQIKTTALGSKNAVSVALQGKAVDVIVADWIWVARQRAAGRPYVFYPYSLTVGGLVVDPQAGIKTLADLEGKRLGVAGGPVDKSWLLLRAYAKQSLNLDLKRAAEPVYAAPPLLNALVKKGDLSAALNFWHYKARLEQGGMQTLVDTRELLTALGVEGDLPVLGWVFDENWAKANPKAVEAFLNASYQAKALLRESDAEWQRIMPLTKAKTQDLLVRLRDGYRAGIPQASAGQAYSDAAAKAFAILAKEGGRELVGPVKSMDKQLFWSRP